MAESWVVRDHLSFDLGQPQGVEQIFIFQHAILGCHDAVEDRFRNRAQFGDLFLIQEFWSQVITQAAVAKTHTLINEILPELRESCAISFAIFG